MTRSQVGLIERKGLNIHYWIGGKADAPLVVFTHGATIDHHEWDATLPLVGENFRILTWDVCGHGLSRPAPFAIEDAVNDLLAILNEIHVEQAVFIGHSMGGNLHQELVFQYPERVKAMACLDCTWNFQKLSALESFRNPIVDLWLSPTPNMQPISTTLISSIKH